MSSGIALAVTDSESGKCERFHPDLVYQVEPQRSGAVISVRGVGRVQVIEPYSKVRADLRTAKLQVAHDSRLSLSDGPNGLFAGLRHQQPCSQYLGCPTLARTEIGLSDIFRPVTVERVAESNYPAAV